MFDQISPLYIALTATLCFSYGSSIFTEFARKVSPFWMNSFKAFIALFTFTITVFAFGLWVTPKPLTLIALLTSGCIGLMIGDIFMLKAMAELGASRMLMIFGIQPFFLGLGGYILFGQSFSWTNVLGLVFMSLCLFTISLENYKKSGHWQASGLIAGLIAILLDGVGLFLTKFSFNHQTDISPIEVNMIRCVGAIIGFFIIYYSKEKIQFQPTWTKFSKKEKMKIVVGSLFGTYISLMLYLTAISKGKLSVVPAVTITGPMFAEIFEIFRTRKLPNIYVVISFIFFICGFYTFTLLGSQ